MDNLTRNSELQLREWNDQKILLNLPAIVYVAVLMILGSFGNILVCVYYGCKTRRTTKSFFIVALAAFDLVVCMITMPLEIVDLRFFYIFTNVPACTIPRFLNHLAAIASASTLIAIAVDRYRRICKPLFPQLEIRHARLAILLAAAFSLSISWPAAVLYEPVKVNVTDDKRMLLEATVCTTSKDEGKKSYLWAFNILLFTVFTSATAVLCILYSLIGRSIYRYKRRRLKYASVKRKTSASKLNLQEQCQAESKYLRRSATTNLANISNKNTSEETLSINHETAPEETATTAKDINIFGSEKSLVDSLDENSNCNIQDVNTVKFTVLMLIITIIFIVGYLPYLALVIWRTFQSDYEWNILGDSELLAFQIGLRSYLLNSMLNPIVYGFFNDKFRDFFFLKFCPCFVKTIGNHNLGHNQRGHTNTITHM